jgi:GT2 family glycosyltransferase
VHAAPEPCELRPDDTVRAETDANGVAWEVNGDHAGFRLCAPAAGSGWPAGWYALRGRIERIAGTVTLPSLQPVYEADVAESAEEIPLPEPSVSGRLHALVLLRHPVSDLHFCPGVLAARFRMRDFSLRRISRATALWMMLRGAGQPFAPGALLRRSARFLAGLGTVGRRVATTAAFSDYLEHQRPRGLTDYDVWIRKYDTLTPSRLANLRQRARACPGVTISVLLPVQNESASSLRRRIDSVRNQLWEEWELCIAGDASCSAEITDLLDDHAARDARIRVAGVAGSSADAFSRALDMVTGGHVLVMGAGAELRPHALLELAELCRRHPDLAFAYADEDWIDDEGRRREPYFKPDWNPDLLRSQNYIGNFALVRVELLRDIGGLRDGFGDGALHDLFLRCTERLHRPRIRHVPDVLYHRHMSARDSAPKLPAPDAAGGVRAVSEHLARLGVQATVEARPGPTFHVRWPLPSALPKVSIVIPTRDRVGLLRKCVQSILSRTTWPNYEIVIVDNQSSQRDALDYLQSLRGRERIRVLKDDAPFNYSAINNRAVAQCDGELVCLLNNDIEVISPGWLEEMAGHALRSEVGAVGAMLYYPNDVIQHAGVVVGLHGAADHVHAGRPRGWSGQGARARVAQELSAVTGACLLVRRAVYLDAGGLDERLAVAFNDIDFCLRLRERGLHNIWTPHAELYHHESASRGRDDTPERQARNASEVAYMRRRWPAMLKADPAWNRNLSLRGFGSGLAFPPRPVPSGS